MIVTINNNWRVRIDDFNHTLEYFIKGGHVISIGKNKGQIAEDSWGTEGYYPNLSQCLRAVVRKEAAALSDTDLNGWLERLEALNEEIKL
jgi:hypothetical protein